MNIVKWVDLLYRKDPALGPFQLSHHVNHKVLYSGAHANVRSPISVMTQRC